MLIEDLAHFAEMLDASSIAFYVFMLVIEQRFTSSSLLYMPLLGSTPSHGELLALRCLPPGSVGTPVLRGISPGSVEKRAMHKSRSAACPCRDGTLSRVAE